MADRNFGTSHALGVGIAETIFTFAVLSMSPQPVTLAGREKATARSESGRLRDVSRTSPRQNISSDPDLSKAGEAQRPHPGTHPSLQNAVLRFADNPIAGHAAGDNGEETLCVFAVAANGRQIDRGEPSTARAMTIATNSYNYDPAGAVETNVAARCKIVVGFESISPARVSFHTRGVVRIFAIRKPVYGRQNRGQTHQIYMRRFTILRNRFPFEINELPPTSPPPSATYPFGFLSPAPPSPEVHPAVGVMRVCASSSNVSAAHPHCFSTLRVSKLKASARIESFAFSAIGSEPAALLRLPASRASALR